MKILVLRFSSIGDIVLTTPVLRCIKKQFPGSELHFASRQKFEGLLEPNPHVDRVHSLDGSLNRLIRTLRREKFDCIIDLHNNLRTRIIKSALWGVKSHTFNKLNLRKALLTRFKIDVMPDKHIVQRYLEAAAPLGLRDDGDGLEFYFPEDYTGPAPAPELPAAFHAYAIGGTWNTKRMPMQKIIEWMGQVTLPVVLLGDKNDAREAEFIKDSFPDRIVNLCGLLDLNGSAWVMQRARSVISHDTGLMHIAAAMQKPIVSIWGNTVPAFGMYPYYGKNSLMNAVIAEVIGLDCRPCSKLGYDECPRGHFRCMMDQDSEGILKALR